MRKARKPKSEMSRIERIFDAFVHGLAGCFVLAIAVPLLFFFVADFHNNPLRGRLSPVGPRVPIPTIRPETLVAGRAVYLREDCNECHVLRSQPSPEGRNPASSENAPPGFAPDLTHEGQRNPSIDWQFANLFDHHRMFSNPGMPDYDDLSPSDLHVLASYLASRR